MFHEWLWWFAKINLWWWKWIKNQIIQPDDQQWIETNFKQVELSYCMISLSMFGVFMGYNSKNYLNEIGR